MNSESLYDTDTQTLEKVAKYICNLHDGLFPMVVENFECRSICDNSTLPWQCGVMLFKETAKKPTMYRYKKTAEKITQNDR